MKRLMLGAVAALGLLVPAGATFAQSDPFSPAGAISAPSTRDASGVLRAENGTFEAAVSAEQLTRISIIGDRIVSVRTLQDPDGPQMLVEAEETTGDVYVGFDGPSLGRSFNLFLVTASGRTLQANLHVSAIAGQNIRVSAGDARPAEGASVERTERRSEYLETATAMVRVLFRNETPEGMRCSPRSAAGRDVGPYSMRVVRTCEGAGLIGQELVINNKAQSTAPVLVDPFLVAGVLAVAADRDELQPGGSARVFLVEESR